jgi:acyl-homoserine lactone acylase PvdQ
LLQDNNSIFDNILTRNNRESKIYIVLKSFKDAVKMLKTNHGNNRKTWRWGKLHKLTLEHPFSEIDFLRPSVTLGEFEVGGNNTTINNTEYPIYESFSVRVGASARLVANMQDSVVYISLPGGVSGDAMNPNYRNQVQLWLTGGYVELPIKREPNSNAELKIKIIKSID